MFRAAAVGPSAALTLVCVGRMVRSRNIANISVYRSTCILEAVSWQEFKSPP